MTDPTSSFFSAVLAEEYVPFDPSEDKYAVGALLGNYSIDSMELYPDSHLPMFNLLDLPEFSDHYQVPADPSASPGVLSPPSLPPSPLSSVDELSDLVSDFGVTDTPTSFPSISPAGLSVLAPFGNTEEVKPTKTDLDGFEYNTLTRKWVCTKCRGDFVSTHEARRHVKTAAKCTGKKVKCLRCNDEIHAAQWSRKRHFGSKKCQKKGRRRGTPTYTVNNAFVEL